MQSKTFFICVVLSTLWVASSDAATVVQKTAPNYCQAAPLQVCDQYFVAQSGTLGNIQTFNMDTKFKTPTISVQCVIDGDTPYYRFLDGPVSCALKTCAPSHISFCGLNVSVGEETSLGNTVTISIPNNLLASSYASSTSNLVARCRLTDGKADYDLDDDGGLSCNAFLCQPTTLPICGSTTMVQHTAELGAVSDEITRDGQAVKVECLGSEGAPHFVVIDNNCN